MQKRVFIVHGWDGYPENGWFPWLKQELENRGWLVVVPQLPQPEEPRINKWIPVLAEIVGTPDEQTYFVGHSMGCQAIARYVETLPEKTLVGGAVFVAGFFSRLTLDNDDRTQSVVKEWLETPLNLEKVKSHLRKSVAIFCDNDPYVPLENKEAFQNMLGSSIVIEHNLVHFSGSTGVTKLSVALTSVLGLAGH